MCCINIVFCIFMYFHILCLHLFIYGCFGLNKTYIIIIIEKIRRLRRGIQEQKWTSRTGFLGECKHFYRGVQLNTCALSYLFHVPENELHTWMDDGNSWDSGLVWPEMDFHGKHTFWMSLWWVYFCLEMCMETCILYPNFL